MDLVPFWLHPARTQATHKPPAAADAQVSLQGGTLQRGPRVQPHPKAALCTRGPLAVWSGPAYGQHLERPGRTLPGPRGHTRLKHKEVAARGPGPFNIQPNCTHGSSLTRPHATCLSIWLRAECAHTCKSVCACVSKPRALLSSEVHSSNPDPSSVYHSVKWSQLARTGALCRPCCWTHHQDWVPPGLCLGCWDPLSSVLHPKAVSLLQSQGSQLRDSLLGHCRPSLLPWVPQEGAQGAWNWVRQDLWGRRSLAALLGVS